MGGVTFALFSSTASNSGNTFGAGTLALVVKNGSNVVSPAFTISNALPGYTETQVINLSNSGNVAAGSTTLASLNVTPNGSGDLGEVLTLDLYNDVNGNGIYDGPDTLIHSGHINSGWTETVLGFGLAASGGSHNLLAKLTFDSGAVNSYQGKSVTFDFNFRADQ
jgi:hypothetical protein